MALGLASVAAGIYASAQFGPERLRRELERQIEQATGAPCRVGRLRVDPGLPLEVEGGRLALWHGALRVERATARVSLGSLLFGRVRLARLELHGAVLGVADLPAPDPAAASLDADAWLAAWPAWLARIFDAAAFADTLIVRDARVELERADAARDGAPLAIEDLRAELTTRRLRGGHQLVARTRLRSGGVDRGLLEWDASEERDGALRVTLNASELDLGWAAGRLGLDAGSQGALSGVAELRAPAADATAPAPEPATLELDWVATDVALAGAPDQTWFAAPRVGGALRLEADAARVQLVESRIESGPLVLALEASAVRPLAPETLLSAHVRILDVEVGALRDAVAEIPASWVEDARVVLDTLDSGRIASLDLRGAAPWQRWRDWADGAGGAAPEGFQLGARVEDLRIRLGENDAIEDLSARIAWQDDRLALRGLRARRGGADLPRLDLELSGVSHLLASDLETRVPDSEDVRLPGLPLLLSLMKPEPGSGFRPPHVEGELSRLDHPALLWPMRDLSFTIDHRDGALVGQIRRGTWAGVPLRGRVAWSDDPMHLRAELVARAPRGRARQAAPPVSRAGLPAGTWALGVVEVGTLTSRIWAHERLQGRVWAVGSLLFADSIEGELRPSGTLEGEAKIDVGRADELPYRTRFRAEGLEAGALLEQAGLGDGLVSGRVALQGDLRARYRRDQHPFAHLSGKLDVAARDGSVRHDVPAVLALTLASENLDLTPQRDHVRYTRCEARLELVDGVMKTDSMKLDGPDVRLFGSGTLDLGHAPHALDAEVVVFLFRPVDRVLGGIPILGDLVLGGADNLFAAYFRLDGPWDAPTATALPLRTFNAGPMRLVTGLPGVVIRSLEALGGAIFPSDAEPLPPPPPFAPEPAPDAQPAPAPGAPAAPGAP